MWWRDLIDYAVLNLLWIGFSLTVIGGPPALAAMYRMAADSADGDYVDWRQFGAAMKALVVPAWRWGLLQLGVYGVIGFNLLFYSHESGVFWAILRLCWFAGLVIWSALNLFYWPFFLEQDDRRITTTYRNTMVFSITRPGLVFGLVVLSVAVIVVSAMTVILFAFAVLPLVALMTTYAVREALAEARNQAARPPG